MVDFLVARRGARAIAVESFGDQSIAGKSAANVATWTLAGAAMVLALLLPALWNGFPLIFPDTGGYLERPLDGTLDMGRSALYGLFLYTGIPFAFWPNVVAQSALTVWLIVLTMRVHGLGGRPFLALGIVAALTVGTSLPWFAGQLMPDILFPAAVLSLYLLMFRSAQTARWERCALAAAIAFAVPSHMAAAGMCVAVIAAIGLLALLRFPTLPKPRLTIAAGAVAAGLLLCPISNFAITGNFVFTPGGTSFLFGRLIEDGIIERYLDDRCPDPGLRLCAYQADLPDDADDWLWSDPAFYELGGWRGFGAEEGQIIVDTLKRYPIMHAEAAATAAARQLADFQTEISIEDNGPTVETFKDRTPGLFPRFMSARQQAEHFDVAPLNLLHVPVAALAIGGLVLATVLRRRLKIAPEAVALCLTILIALAANAAICGIFSHPVDRYQSRLAPLAPLAVALLITGRRRRPDETT